MLLVIHGVSSCCNKKNKCIITDNTKATMITWRSRLCSSAFLVDCTSCKRESKSSVLVILYPLDFELSATALNIYTECSKVLRIEFRA